MKNYLKRPVSQDGEGVKVCSEKRLFLILSAVLATLLITTQLLEAAPLGNYTTANDGNWHDPNTWNQNSIPDSNTNVTIEHDVTIQNGKKAKCKNLKIGFNRVWLIVWWLDYGNIQVNQDAELVVKGNINQATGNGSAVNLSNSLNFAQNSTLVLRGNQQQHLPDQSFASLENVVIHNNAAKPVSPQSTIQINGTLELRNNKLTSSLANLVLISNSNDLHNLNKNHYIDGPFYINDEGAMGFHIPSNNNLKRVHIKNAAQTADFSISHNNQSYNPNQLGANLNKVSDLEHFQITPSGNLPNNQHQVKLFWNSKQNQGIKDTANLVVAHYKNGNWVNEDKSQVTLNPDGSGSITSGNVSSFSPFALGSTTSSQPLPVELMNFTVQQSDNGPLLKWATASETNNSHFQIQRSTNGQNFHSIGRVQGHGTTTEQQSYQFEDPSLENGTNYYRLKQVDHDGSYEFSPIQALDTQDSAIQIESIQLKKLTPNPFNTHLKVSYQLEEEQPLDFYLTDQYGKLIHHEKLQKATGMHRKSIKGLKPLKAGIYFFTLMGENKEITQKVLKR